VTIDPAPDATGAEQERDRLRALDALRILDTPPEAAFDDLAWLASRTCEAPISLVTLVSAEHLWFKARCGLDLERVPRREGFCDHAIRQDDLLEVPDARLDDRFADLPSVVGASQVRFYAGMPLRDHQGRRLGTLCVLDTRPRTLTEAQREGLRRLSRCASDSLESRRRKLVAEDRRATIAGLLEALPDGVVTCDANGVLAEFNGVARDWHGVDPRACAQEEWASHFGLYDERGAELLRPDRIPLVRAWRGERVRGQTIVIRTPREEPRTVSCNADPLLDDEGVLHGAVCTMHDITEQIRLRQRMEEMALTDALTGLPNRAAWFAELDRAVARARRSGGPVRVLFIDLDRFKQINDRLGHAAGDEVLRQFGARLRQCCRRNDFVARLSGDEFVVCLDRSGDGALDPPDPLRIAQKIYEAMAPPMAVAGEPLTVGCSIGHAVEAGPEFDTARLMERADASMYEAKRSYAAPAATA
jgi:diguanylate cyclase (GGDEF)-like protein